MKTTGKIFPTSTALLGTGTSLPTIDQMRSLVGQDVEVTYRVNMSLERVFVGTLVGIADRASTANPPDLVLKNRSVNLILVNTARVIKVRSTMELLGVWDLNPMELARIGYEAWKGHSGLAGMYEWVDLPDSEKEIWLACSEAIRSNVNQGI